MRKVLLTMAGWLLAMTATAKGDGKVYQFDKPLYGAAYYSEYTPTDRLDEDIRQYCERIIRKMMAHFAQQPFTIEPWGVVIGEEINKNNKN